jgi:hypothetical protein
MAPVSIFDSGIERVNRGAGGPDTVGSSGTKGLASASVDARAS